MKSLITLGFALLGGLMFFLSHRVIAQMENVKLVEDERLISGPAPAQPFIGEQAIRALVEQQNRGLQVVKTSDVFVTESASERTTQRHERIVRLVVAQSGELAYEYGNYVPLSAQPNVKTQSAEGSYLRVWRKQNGEWLVDATVAQP